MFASAFHSAAEWLWELLSAEAAAKTAQEAAGAGELEGCSEPDMYASSNATLLHCSYNSSTTAKDVCRCTQVNCSPTSCWLSSYSYLTVSSRPLPLPTATGDQSMADAQPSTGGAAEAGSSSAAAGPSPAAGSAASASALKDPRQLIEAVLVKMLAIYEQLANANMLLSVPQVSMRQICEVTAPEYACHRAAMACCKHVRACVKFLSACAGKVCLLTKFCPC